jgi:CheY-like chemotaxis protein
MPHTILTIEDHDDIRRLIRLTLEYKGHTVLEAPDGTQGLARARQHRPDLILLDVMMEGLDGLSVAQTLAADPELRRIPVVMISALGTPDDVQAGLDTGARAYLVKPFSPLDLLSKVNRLVDEARSAG